MSSVGFDLIETVPDLSVKSAGLVPAGTDPGVDARDLKDIMAADQAPKGTFEFWAWLQGDDKALDYLRKHPEILPLKQEVYVPTLFGPNFVHVEFVGAVITQRPGWAARYLEILAGELKTKGTFISSGLSRYAPAGNVSQYKIRFRTSDGKLLASADGRLLVATIIPGR
ncbi:MAG TPA: hypothetical protein VGM54_17750 [Chthoniobacter sp.]